MTDKREKEAEVRRTDQRSGRSRLLAAAAAVAVLAGAAALGSVALAHDKVFRNAVTLGKADRLAGGAPGIYRGRVLSPSPKCKHRREVQIYRADVTPEVRIRTTRTTPRGRWKTKGPALPDGAKVYALIETRVVTSNPAHDHSCPVDRSPVRTIPYP
jgi:hypothetical protein